jgi:hypothetical protein
MYERICIGGPVHFPTIKNDLAALVSIPDIDEIMTVALASVDKSMYPSGALRELATITSDYPTDNIFLQMGR